MTTDLTPDAMSRLQAALDGIANLPPDNVRPDANNVVIVHDNTEGELRTFVMSTNGQVYVTEVFLHDGVARGRCESLSLAIEDGMTHEEYADKIFRDFPDPHASIRAGLEDLAAGRYREITSVADILEEDTNE